MATEVELYVRSRDPACEQVEAFLTEREIPYEKRDVEQDPAASATLFGHFGRIVVPVTRVGEAYVVGYDPIQLLKLFPGDVEGEPLTLGASIRTVTKEIAEAHGLPFSFGVEVGTVQPGSIAERSGLAASDVITEVSSYTLIQGADQLRQVLRAKREGDVVPLTVWRDRKPVAIALSFTSSADADS